MDIHYINLENRTDRNHLFLQRNTDITSLIKVDATQGSELDRNKLIENKFIAPELTQYSAGALGCAMSHLKLWERARDSGVAMTIAEDDAIFNRQFTQCSAEVLSQLDSDWDICLWGWNFDSILKAQLPEEKHARIIKFSQKELRDNVAAFQEMKPDCKPVRLLNAFGLMCYSISPKGAKYFIDHCFPLVNELVPVHASGKTHKILNTSSDIVMNKYFATAKSYACFPPLVASENYKAESDLYQIEADSR